MKLFLKLLKYILLFSILTTLTQVGGIIYLLYQPFSFFVKKRKYDLWKSLAIRIFAFSTLYLVGSLLIVPFLAKQNGRVALPYFYSKETPVKCGNILFALANRNYVKSVLKDVFFETTRIFEDKYPGAQLVYLDANFPFWDGFPLLPHLSHDDGEKLDIAFLYKNKATHQLHNEALSFYGYGFCEEPRKGEVDKPAECEKKGNWEYNFLRKITSQRKKKFYEFDEEANRFLLLKLIENQRVRKIFIEPHLKERLGLGRFEKIRYHGCHAVRHDDHIHFQL